MKIFFGVLLLVSSLGILFLVLTPSIYKKTAGHWHERLMAYRAIWIFIFIITMGVGAFGWQNIAYSDTNYSNSSGSSGYVQSLYPIYNASYKVLDVTDGNKAEVELSKGSATVKLIGLDMFSSSDQQQNACYKKNAKNKLSDLLAGKKVELEGDDSLDDADKSDALLRYLIYSNKNIGQQMLSLGFAKASDNIDYKYRSDFLAAEKDAKSKELGLWSNTVCAPEVKSAAAPAKNYIKSTPFEDNNKNSGSKSSGGKQSGDKGSGSSSGGGKHNSRNNDDDNDTNQCIIRLPILGCL